MNGWLVSWSGSDPTDEGRREALCTLGNGYFATRGAAPECVADERALPGHLRRRLLQPAARPGRRHDVENESLVNLPNWLRADVPGRGRRTGSPTGSEAARAPGRARPAPRRLTRRLRLRGRRRADALGSPSDASCTWPSRTSPACDTDVTAGELDGTAPRRAPCIDARVENTRCRPLPRAVRPAPDGDRAAHGRGRGPRGGADKPVARAGRRRPAPGSAGARRARSPGGAAGRVRSRRSRPTCTLDVRAGQPRHDREGRRALYTSRDPAISEPAGAALEQLRALPGLRRAARPPPRRVEHLWRRFASRLERPAPASRRSPRSAPAPASTCCRRSPAHASTSTSACRPAACTVRPTGATSSGTSCSSSPSSPARAGADTRSLLRYRYRRLPAARRAARGGGLSRARCSRGSPAATAARRASGCTSTRCPGAGSRTRPRAAPRRAGRRLQRLAVRRGHRRPRSSSATTAPRCSLEIARFFAGLADLRPGRDRYVIRGVVGPDEFHTGYPDAERRASTTTPTPTSWRSGCCARAAILHDRCPPRRRDELVETLGLRRGTRPLGRHHAAGCSCPFHDGVISQFEGYERARRARLGPTTGHGTATSAGWTGSWRPRATRQPRTRSPSRPTC